MAQPIVDGLLTEDDVGDVAAGLDRGGERRRDGPAGLAAYLTVRLAQPDQRLFERHVPRLEVDGDPGAELFEQSVPCRVSDRAEVREHTLLGLGKLVRSEFP